MEKNGKNIVSGEKKGKREENHGEKKENAPENEPGKEENREKEKIHGEKEGPEKLEKKIKELTEDLQRLQAEFENYQKRIEREKGEFMEYAKAGVLKSFLPVMDSIGSATEKLGEKGMEAEGIKAIKKQLEEKIKSFGVNEMKALGKKFDSGFHECMMTGEEKEKKDDEVLEEFQKGYLINGKVLRPAKVKVNKLESEEK